MNLSFDDQVALKSMLVIEKWCEKMKTEVTPVTVGVVMKYKSMIPKKTPDEILESESSPYWFGYAEALKEYLQVFTRLEVGGGKIAK